MRRFFCGILGAFVLLGMVAWAGVLPTKFYVWLSGVSTAYTIDSDEMTFADGAVTIKGTTYQLADIDSITFQNSVVPSADIDTVYVTYSGTSATVSQLPEGMTDSIVGADVYLTSTITDKEMVTVLSGSSTSGSFTYTGDYKTTVRLNGLTLKGSSEEAVHIKDGKRVALEVADGTTNTLEDASTDGGQKGAFYTKGHLEISGGGTLNLVGNIKHALASKEYMLIKKTAGTINITGAASDGIHAGEYVQINGGSITVKGVAGDGIQAELVTPDDGESIEDNGKLIIKGGTINVTTTGNDVAALKADSTLHIKDGDITLSCSGNGSKCMKSDVDVDIEGGTMNLTQSGGLYEDTGSDTPSTTKSYKVYVSTGNTLTNTSSNKYWPSVYLYKSDGTLVQKLTSTATATVNNQTLTFFYYDFKQSDSGTYYFKSDDYYSSYYGATYSVYSSTFTGPTSGSDSYYQITSSYTTSGTVRTYKMSSVTPGSSSTTEGDLSSSHGIKGDGGVTISGGDIIMKMTGTGSKGISSDKNITVTGGTINITNSGAGQASGTTTYTAKGFTADGNIALEGGTITINMSGSGGKCIKADGMYTQGTSDGEGPTIIANTTGSSLSGGTSTGGNTGGWGGPGGGGPGGGGQSTSSGSSAKAIKALGAIIIYGGTTEISTSTNGAEGIESKTSIDIRGGKIYVKAYDDCINSSGCIYFNGGVTVCYGYGNDAVDSNAGKTGAITIGNGVVFAYSTKGSPEEGLDCDNNSYIQITGTGIGISAGAAQGGGSSSSTISNAKQGYTFVTSSISYSTGRYYTLADASGNNLVTYSFAASCSSSLSLFTATGMVKGSSYNVMYSTSAPTDATTAWHGLYLGSSATGTSSVTSFTAK